MDIETLTKANRLLATIREIEGELQAWDETTSASQLGRAQHWNSGHLVPLPCKHSSQAAFAAYRDACINALKVARAEAEAEIAAL